MVHREDRNTPSYNNHHPNQQQQEEERKKFTTVLNKLLDSLCGTPEKISHSAANGEFYRIKTVDELKQLVDATDWNTCYGIAKVFCAHVLGKEDDATSILMYQYKEKWNINPSSKCYDYVVKTNSNMYISLPDIASQLHEILKNRERAHKSK